MGRVKQISNVGVKQLPKAKRARQCHMGSVKQNGENRGKTVIMGVRISRRIEAGAGDEIRTRDPLLGKQVLYR
jgi:hypothetical protein